MVAEAEQLQEEILDEEGDVVVPVAARPDKRRKEESLPTIALWGNPEKSTCKGVCRARGRIGSLFRRPQIHQHFSSLRRLLYALWHRLQAILLSGHIDAGRRQVTTWSAIGAQKSNTQEDSSGTNTYQLLKQSDPTLSLENRSQTDPRDKVKNTIALSPTMCHLTRQEKHSVHCSLVATWLATYTFLVPCFHF